MSLTPLVSYPDSESDEDVKTAPSARSELPPLPSAFHDLYSTNARTSTSDDPSLHGGRKRAIPHVEGNWPSHVYLEWVPSRTESEQLHQLILNVKASLGKANQNLKSPLPVPDLKPSLLSPLGAPLPLHISLSRTLQIKTDDREAFLNALTTRLRKAAVRPFNIGFTKLNWVPNFERNRWFLVLGIERPPADELNKLLEACNKASIGCGFPGLYTGGEGDGPMEENSERAAKRKKSSIASKKASGANGPDAKVVSDYTDYFHVSIAWNLDTPMQESINIVRDMDLPETIGSLRIPFDTVKARIGNIVHNIPISKAPPNGRETGILGLVS